MVERRGDAPQRKQEDDKIQNQDVKAVMEEKEYDEEWDAA